MQRQDASLSYGAELIQWKNKAEYYAFSIYWKEGYVNDNMNGGNYWTGANDLVLDGDWMWGDSMEFVPMDYGWINPPDTARPDHHCTALENINAKLGVVPCEDGICCADGTYFFICQMEKA